MFRWIHSNEILALDSVEAEDMNTFVAENILSLIDINPKTANSSQASTALLVIPCRYKQCQFIKFIQRYHKKKKKRYWTSTDLRYCTCNGNSSWRKSRKHLIPNSDISYFRCFRTRQTFTPRSIMQCITPKYSMLERQKVWKQIAWISRSFASLVPMSPLGLPQMTGRLYP